MIHQFHGSVVLAAAGENGEGQKHLKQKE
jgi:hypothetical protein